MQHSVPQKYLHAPAICHHTLERPHPGVAAFVRSQQARVACKKQPSPACACVQCCLEDLVLRLQGCSCFPAVQHKTDVVIPATLAPVSMNARTRSYTGRDNRGPTQLMWGLASHTCMPCRSTLDPAGAAGSLWCTVAQSAGRLCLPAAPVGRALWFLQNLACVAPQLAAVPAAAPAKWRALALGRSPADEAAELKLAGPR
jgi:hypothetical protein